MAQQKILKQRTFHPRLCQVVVCERLCSFPNCSRPSDFLTSRYAFSRFRFGFTTPYLLRLGTLDMFVELEVDASFSKVMFKIGYFCQSL
jgi:hypothetical protein